MRIAFLVNPVFNGWSPTDTRLGGTEESVVRWAEEMTRLGHQVEVYKNGPELDCNGVSYIDRSKYSGADVTINIKSPDIPPQGPTWYLTNEVDAARLDLAAYNGVIWPSQWAADHIKVNNPSIHIVSHGYDPKRIYPEVKLPKTVLYASSPDRGLSTLLDVWPKVLQAHPDAMLLVTYGANPKSIANVMFLGELSEDEMDELYRTSDIWCHPCNGGELFGITGIKAQAAGCVPVYFPAMALSETVQSGLKTSPALLADDLIRVLGDETLKEAIRQDLATKTFPTWESSTARLLEVFAL